MKPPTITQLRNGPPAVDLMTAAAVLGLGRTKAYDLAKRGEFPVPVIRIGDTYRVPTAGLLRLLGITEAPACAEPAPGRTRPAPAQVRRPLTAVIRQSREPR
jgi:predicted DNA-binding transcriptional regulator AlpA